MRCDESKDAEPTLGLARTEWHVRRSSSQFKLAGVAEGGREPDPGDNLTEHGELVSQWIGERGLEQPVLLQGERTDCGELATRMRREGERQVEPARKSSTG